jgi:DNA-directed RNA polymerase sigma subunit (sigma70/sigma32)
MAIHYARQVSSLYDADDMLQFAIIAIIERLQSMPDAVTFAYIRGIAARTMANKLRVQRTLSLNEPIPGTDEEWIDNLVEKPSQPIPIASLAQRRKAFKLLSCLSPKARSVIMAHFGIEDHRHRCKSVEQVCHKYQMTEQQFQRTRSDTLYRMRNKHLSRIPARSLAHTTA